MDILIVDDEAAELRNMENVLRNVLPGVSLSLVRSAAEALSLAEEKVFDVAFLDIEMPGMDGLTLAKELINRFPLINIIMLTAYPQYALDAHKLFVSG